MVSKLFKNFIQMFENNCLGPKLIIFHRMIPELMIFMMLLIIFILGYGTASQALIHPSRTFQVLTSNY